MPPSGDVAEVLQRLPQPREVVSRLGGLLVTDCAGQIDPDPGQSLRSCLPAISEGESRVRIVLGETRGPFRGDRNAGWTGGLVAASSSDGGAAAVLTWRIGQIRAIRKECIDYDYVCDQWERTPAELQSSHLIVIGTHEVNIVAAFLRQLTEEGVLTLLASLHRAR